MTRVPVATALTIAGSDPSGGAGLQADLKTFHQHGVYGMAVVSLLTVQNTRRVSRVEGVDPGLVREQLEAVLEDVPPRAVKTGALGSAAVIEVVAAAQLGAPLVVDPVMVSKHGHALLEAAARTALQTKLLPRATLVTPNAEEAALLVGFPVETVAQATAAGLALARQGQAVLVKGGHLKTDAAVDVLVQGARVQTFEGPRLASPHTHGTGCALSAAITARLALGHTLEDAVAGAKQWLSRALAEPPEVGQGIGPPNHLVR